MLLPFLTPASLALATREAVLIFADDGSTLGRATIAAKTLEWSPDGRTLAILAKDGKLSTLVAGGEPVTVAESADEAVWSRDGRLLFAQGAKGILTGSPSVSIVPTAHSPAPSPDGSRLAFATDGAQGGVWTAEGDGSGARRLLRGERTGGVSWSYDGRWLAAVVDGRLRLLRSNGLSARDLGPVTNPTVRWSLGSPELVVRREKGWSVYDFLRDVWTDVRFDAAPRWTGPSRLTGVASGRAVETTVGGATKALGGDAVDVAAVVGLYRGASFPDPFARAPRPIRGMAWRGQILSSDPVAGTISVLVEAETDVRGRETFLGRAAVRRARVPVGPLVRRLAVLPETDAWLVVDRGLVVDAFLPDVPAAPEPPPRGRTIRPSRATEYDGVTRERIIAPLTYPIPGRHRLVDTFLAPRGGGTRRHHGNDLMAPKMTPLLAVFDGVVSFRRTNADGASNMLTLQSDDGWSATYIHINNDNPGTDDGRGSLRYAFPADLQPGDRVRAGQVVAWCGDSGNAEGTGPHLHFELYDGDGGAIVDPFYSLMAARRLPTPRYPDPDPELRAERGETRWDGVVLSVDRAKRAVAVELTGVGVPSRAPIRNLKPRVVYLTFAVGRTLRYRGSDVAYPFDSVQPGMRVSGVGSPKGTKMAVRSASMALPSG